MIGTDISINHIPDFLSSNELIGVMAGVTGIEQLHCGIIYKSNGNFNAIHLAWHFCLVHDTDHDKFINYIWLKPSIHKTRQNILAAMCRQILKREQKQDIPYGLIYHGGKFIKDGLMLLKPTESGLTCATFVLAIFKSCGIELIDVSLWESRQEDSTWHKSVIESLYQTKEKFNISDAHIENVKREIGCARFRPEEVTASSALFPTPAPSHEIRLSGEIVKTYLLNQKKPFN